MRPFLRLAPTSLVVACTIALVLPGAISPAAADSTSATRATSKQQPWRDTKKSPDWRADRLLKAMTLDEKITLILATNDEDFAPLAHLGIPIMRRVDASDGLRGDTGVTAFPAPNALGATFDTDLAVQYGDAIGAEARAKRWNVLLGPTVDIDRNGLSGRAAEGYGEDPLVNGEMGAAVSRGFEQNDVITQLKHFTVYNQESHRQNLNVAISERALREVHYPPFEQAIREGGADSVMCSYAQVNGTYACENAELLTDLKTDLGRKGYVGTDFQPSSDPIAGINAGIDSQALYPGVTPREAFTDGRIPIERTNDAVRRILVALFDSGAFDNPLVETAVAVATTPAHQELARTVGAAATVLLKNDGALPLSASDSVAVIGAAGEDTVTGIEGSSYVQPGDFTTPVEAFQQKAGAANVAVSQGSLGDGIELPVVPSSALRTAGGAEGLDAVFFGNDSFDGAPIAETVTPTVNFAFGNPVPDLPSAWSARWTGTITPTDSGLLRISSLLSGSAKVTIDGKTFFDGERFIWDFFFSPQQYTIGGTLEVDAGVPLDIAIEYSTKDAGFFGPRLTLGWQPDSLIPEAVEAARNADSAVVFVNEVTGEAVDRLGYSLPGDQNELIEAVVAVNPNTIVVLQTPGPITMPWLDDVAGVVQSWYQGAAAGTSIADVVYGDAEPGGRLPVTFPASEDQVPALDRESLSVAYDEGIYVGYKWFDKTGETPLFPFGYGLSYTSFAYDKLKVGGYNTKAAPHSRAGSPVVTVNVTNTGDRAGSDVVQVYAGSLPTDAIDTPERRLAGFAKVDLQPGEKKKVTVQLDRSAFAYWDEASDKWVTPKGQVRLFVARSATDVQLQGALTVR
ncbi:glycoside hydrolase family 3 protein [Micromonospora sp. DT81.3]|uniref:beta-glucosidase n=1 Tax=Micromonospora sp. DT81.3 TaxID=3416523 RepID=UPI003CE6D39C